MDALVTAGGIPKSGDPLYEHTQGNAKALVDIAGRPMIQWVLDAISGSVAVDRVVIVGLPADSAVACSKAMTFIPNHGGILENIRAGVEKVLELNPDAQSTIIVSADIPAITPEMIDWAVNTSMETEHDLYYNVISRKVMESRFPGSRRSYVRMRDAEVCGGDMHVMRTSIAVGDKEIHARLVAARKRPLKQAALIGYNTLLPLLLHRLTLENAVSRISKRLGINGKAILSPYAEIGMDVDKPFQLEILRVELGRKHGGK